MPLIIAKSHLNGKETRLERKENQIQVAIYMAASCLLPTSVSLEERTEHWD